MRRRTVLKSAGSVPGFTLLGSAGNGTYTKEDYDSQLYRKFLPSDIGDGYRIPLVVMLHGCGQSPDQFRRETRMNRLAEREGFAVIYPDQTARANSGECWKWFRDRHTTRGSGETALVTGMAREVVAEHDVDPQRVYVAGLSAGGAMVPNLLAAYPDVYAAGGIHSGLEYDAANKLMAALFAMRTRGPDPRKKGEEAYEDMVDHDVVDGIPTAVIHGTDDDVVAPANGHQAAEQAIRTNDLIAGRAADDRAGSEPDEICTGSAAEYDYTVSRYYGRRNAPIVEKWMVHGMGHAWSGGESGGEYTEPGGPDATRALWEFLRQHTRPQ